MRRIILVAYNLRSSHNVGSLLRTAEGLGTERVYLTGYTPYPKTDEDPRLPHLSQAQHRQIHKTALGAEDSLAWQSRPDAPAVLNELRVAGYRLVGLEQTPRSLNLARYTPPARLALIVGNEVSGLDAGILRLIDECVQIPMLGQKESFNVVQAAAMALFHCRYAHP